MFPAAISSDTHGCPINWITHRFSSPGEQGSRRSPSIRIEDFALSHQRSVKIDDTETVLLSAEILQKTEFEVFEMAYQAWYREVPETTRLERIFARYMFDGIAPFWVRQFTRSTLDAHREWRRDEEMTVGAYLGGCLRATVAAIRATSGLALSLFLPGVIFPGLDTDFAALPA